MKIVAIASALVCLVACGSSSTAGDVVEAPAVTDDVTPSTLPLGGTIVGIMDDKGHNLDTKAGNQMTTQEFWYCCVTKAGCTADLFGGAACSCTTDSANTVYAECSALAKLD